MEQILNMIAKWDGMGQAIFFLIVLGGVFSLFYKLSYFLTVLVRGWPVNHPEE